MENFTNNELLSGNKLYSLSQQELLSLVESNEEVGIVINDRISIVMLKWVNYEELLNTLVIQENRINELESYFEDLILAEYDSGAIEAAEHNNTEEYVVNNLGEVLNMLKRRNEKSDSSEF